jgi:2-hydroxy-3-keto-5-methylthiopentenyl-1-phosphate phosphatase
LETFVDRFGTSSFGYDKALEIRPYANLPEDERPVLFYAGDGVSDFSAAKETDLLFAKAGRGMLANHCPCMLTC